MNKLEYFLRALNAGAYTYKEWIIECFGIVRLFPKPEGELVRLRELPEEEREVLPYMFDDEPDRFRFERYPYQLFNDGGKVVFCDPEEKVWVELPELTAQLKAREAFFRFMDRVDLPARAIPNLLAPVKNTCYGNIMLNQSVLVYSFGDRIPYQEGKFSLKKVEGIIAQLCTSLPEDDNTPRDPKLIYVDEVDQRYYHAAYNTSGWLQLGVPAATPYTITVSPEIRVLRKKLLEDHIDELNNPVVIAKIMGELIKADKAWQAQDPNAGFLQPGKTFDVVRAKQFLMHGIEYDFTDRSKITVIERSLSEQWDITKLPQMANSLIDGSYNRGAMTALGGELAKVFQRFFLSTVISMEDCKTKLGRYRDLSQENIGWYHGAYVQSTSGDVLVTQDNEKTFIGKTVLVRSPMYCQATDGNFCIHCMGENFRNREQSLPAVATEIGNRLMYIMMSRMHGVALKSEKMEWKAMR